MSRAPAYNARATRRNVKPASVGTIVSTEDDLDR